jgi:hypothetical protein
MAVLSALAASSSVSATVAAQSPKTLPPACLAKLEPSLPQPSATSTSPAPTSTAVSALRTSSKQSAVYDNPTNTLLIYPRCIAWSWRKLGHRLPTLGFVGLVTASEFFLVRILVGTRRYVLTFGTTMLFEYLLSCPGLWWPGMPSCLYDGELEVTLRRAHIEYRNEYKNNE